jgi:hypothetical protein
MPTLWEALEGLPDRRTRKGRRYSLASIVGISIAAMLSGANDLMAIYRWGRRLSVEGLRSFGITRERAPCHATYHYVLRAIAADDLDRALCGQARGDGPVEHLAIDGKRLRGSRQGDHPGLHVLSAFCTNLQVCVGNFVVPSDSGELPEAIAMLKGLSLPGAVLTADAAFTNRAMVEAIRQAGADYFLFVKDNQPELKTELAHAFGDDSPLGGRIPSGDAGNPPAAV